MDKGNIIYTQFYLEEVFIIQFMRVKEMNTDSVKGPATCAVSLWICFLLFS